MISDTEELSGIKLDDLFANLDAALSHNGSVWKYSRNREFSSSAAGFDKFFTEQLNHYAVTLNGKQSVLAHLSVRDILTPHIANKYILQTDLKKYYESISFSVVKDHFDKAKFDVHFIEHIRLFYFDGSGMLRRGLKGSAIISELVGVRIDNGIGRLLYELGLNGTSYSRYYDDLLFSSDERDSLRMIEAKLPAVLEAIGMRLNTKKSKLRMVNNSLVLGLRVYDSNITVPKKFKHLMRAREHELNKFYGSVNWSDEGELHELKRFAGHVIGSLWYVVKNSYGDTIIYEEKIEKYKDILRECDAAIEALRPDDESVLYEL